MFKIGRLCLKIAGRDAGLKCIVVEVIDSNYVLIDGQTRRRKCNIIHLEPLDKVLKVKKGLVHNDVVKELKKEGIEVKVKQKRVKKAKTEEKPAVKKEIPKKQEKPELKKEKPAAKPKKKEAKKAEAKPKKTVVKKSPVKKVGKATKKVSKVKPKAKTTKK